MPRRSSAENTSPATTEVSSGKNQLPANDSTTSAPAQPVACISRPKRVSDGSVPCPLTTMTAIAGPIQHARISRRTRHWASCLTSSKRKARATGTGRAAGAAAVGATVVAVTGRTPSPAWIPVAR